MTSSQKPEAVTLDELGKMVDRRILLDDLIPLPADAISLTDALNETGYEEMRNIDEPDRKWSWDMGVKIRIFARSDLSLDEQMAAAKARSDSTQDKTPRNPGPRWPPELPHLWPPKFLHLSGAS